MHNPAMHGTNTKMNNLTFYAHCNLLENRNKISIVSCSFKKYKPIRTHDLTLQKQAQFQKQQLATEAN
jgi:hypothetical protein